MTKPQEIKHILKMIEDKAWMDDSAVADEINARVWLNSGKADGWSLDELKCSDGKYRVVKMQGRMVFECPEYLNSLDAIKGLEREGWFMITRNFGEKNTATAGKERQVYEALTPALPTEQAARLHAVLQTWLHDEENK